MTLLDELRAVDPARDVEVSPELAARVLAARRPRRRRWRVLAPSLVVIAASAVAILWSRGGSPDLAAKAYAATSGKGIVHWRMDFVKSHQRIEGWQLGRVRHILHSDVVHGEVRVTVEERFTAKRVSYWSNADYRWHARARAKESPGNNPLPNGDPFVNFRRAYKAGRLHALGGGRFDVRLKNFRPGDVVYRVDPKTGHPLTLTIKPGTVVRFNVYETLPVTAANRALLDRLPHEGPGSEPASKYFAALRTGTAPADFPQGLVKEWVKRFQLDLGGTRELADGVWIVPGKGFVCLAARQQHGSGATCQVLKRASKLGIAMGSTSGELIAVPDGVKAVRAREDAEHAWRTYRPAGGVVRLPSMKWRWKLVR